MIGNTDSDEKSKWIQARISLAKSVRRFYHELIACVCIDLKSIFRN